MAASMLRRYTQNVYAAGVTTFSTVVAAVPGGRALAVSRVIVANITTQALTFSLQVSGGVLAYQVTLNAGEVYTETGLVLIAADNLQASCSVLNGMHVTVFGEEVDN